MATSVTHLQPQDNCVTHYAKTRIAVTKGPDTGLSIEVAGQTVRIGTSSENDLILSDQTVSRRHCELYPTDTGFRVRDFGSTNGVLWGNARVQDARFSSETALSLGLSVITVTPLTETVAREQSLEARFGDLLGSSLRMRELFAELKLIAPTEVSVLIEGETGTGKELVAESIHRASQRAEGPFVVFDCGAVAPGLAESELFGHERGAFTGAINTRAGVFEQADGGTLFLDELGELPRELQPKLLRVLQKRELRRVGGNRTIPVDVRLLAATNRNLREEVLRRNFREDLYFRVAAAHVRVPALRDRMEDLPLLVEQFLRASDPSKDLGRVSSDVWDILRAYSWPGNVRELQNAVQRMLITPENPLKGSLREQPESGIRPTLAFVPALRDARRKAADDFERQYLKTLLDKTDGNISQAARLADVSRQAIQSLLRKHGF